MENELITQFCWLHNVEIVGIYGTHIFENCEGLHILLFILTQFLHNVIPLVLQNNIRIKQISKYYSSTTLSLPQLKTYADILSFLEITFTCMKKYIVTIFNSQY